MVTATARSVREDMEEFERLLLDHRFNLNNYQWAPSYVLQKLQYYNVKLLQLANSVNRFKGKLPQKFMTE